MSSVMTTYASSTLSFEKGSGMYLFTSDGRKYLDFCSGIAVSTLGHGHPHLVNAIKEQAEKVIHFSNLYTIPGQEKMARRLTSATFASSVFFCNSGTEAVECGIKVARKYHSDKGNKKRNRIITFNNSFHGRTLAPLSAAMQQKHMAGFKPMLKGFDQIEFNNISDLRGKITEQTAAILIEPIQGEGGINSATKDYLEQVHKIAKKYDVLLFLDEVQTGIGRTGKLFAYQWTNIEPDIMAVAKGLGGGFPVGACLTNEKVSSSMTPGTHGSTFGGNPMAMAAANAVLDEVLSRGFLSNVVKMSQLLQKGLKNAATDYPDMLGSVRGKGLLVGIECKCVNTDLVSTVQDLGLLVVPAGNNVVRFIPPLTVKKFHIEEALSILNRACLDMSA